MVKLKMEKSEFVLSFFVLSVWLMATCVGQQRPDFQLTGGVIPNEGRLQVRFPNTTEWVGVCRSSVYPIYASVICQDLGWWSACETLTTSEASASYSSSSIYTLQARCLGWETSLSQCDEISFEDSSLSCKPGEDAWLVCLADPASLQVRLSGGSFEGEGYVEMRCPGQKWSTVCAQNWDMRDANIACKQLGYFWSFSTTPEAAPPVTLGSVGYSNFLCNGVDEGVVGECSFTQELDKCPGNFAGVQCGVELNRQMADVPASLCGGHHCGQRDSTHPVYDPRTECRCDCLCTRFNDCCFDRPNQNITCNDVEESFWKGIEPSLYGCSPGPLSDIYNTAYVMITKCPASFPNDIERTLCEMNRTSEDVIGLLPVYDSSNRIFKNVFCAVCHGLTVHDVTQWGLVLNYDPLDTTGGGYVNPSLITVISGKLIGFQIIPPDKIVEARRCPYGVIDNCPDDTRDVILHQLCSSHYAPVTFNGTVYRNPHCAMCNGVAIPGTQYCNMCAPECPIDPFIPCMDVPCQTQFSTEEIQFSLDAFFGGVYGQTEQVSCPQGDLYDPFLRRCTLIPCTPSFDRSPELCFESHNTTQPIPTVSHEVHTVPKTTTEDARRTWMHPFLFCLLEAIGFTGDLTGIEEVISSEIPTLDVLPEYCTDTILTSLSLIFEDPADAYPLVEFIDSADVYTNSEECPSCNISNVNIYIRKQLPRISESLKDECLIFYEFETSGNKTKALTALWKYNLTDNSDPTRIPDYCLQENVLTCVTTTFDPSVYRFVDADRSVWLLDYNITLSREDYIFHIDGTIDVCSSLLLTPWSSRPLFEIAIVGCIVLSVMSLLLIFITYIADSALRDISGKCLLNMFVAFIFGLTLSVVCEFFLFHHIACTTVAAVGHFSLLGAFCWLTLFAVVIALGIDGKKGYTFFKMFGFGWIVPAVGTGLCLWIHFCQCMNVQLSYGGGVMCWLQGSEALLFACVVPITVLILVSTIAFLCGAIRVHKVRQYVTAFTEAITESTVGDVILYLVLCLLLLIPWILAITYLLFQIAILNDIYRIAFALQGVFIVAALLCTDKVRSLCKRKPEPVSDDLPVAAVPGINRQLSTKLAAPDGASNRVWLKRESSVDDIPGSVGGDDTWL